jgi:hypothetical protein
MRTLSGVAASHSGRNTIVLADDDTLLREGIACLLRDCREIRAPGSGFAKKLAAV